MVALACGASGGAFSLADGEPVRPEASQVRAHRGQVSGRGVPASVRGASADSARLTASLSPAALPAAAAAMGAQDRPQCHFDIEINREPGEERTARQGGPVRLQRPRAGRGRAGRASSLLHDPGPAPPGRALRTRATGLRGCPSRWPLSDSGWSTWYWPARTRVFQSPYTLARVLSPPSPPRIFSWISCFLGKCLRGTCWVMG